MRPFCFILMPFGIKKDPESSRDVNFDSIYAEIIRPAVEDADMEPLRGDEEIISGIIHKPMFERLMLCDFAVADLTTANANVFYELGIRHAARPHSTVLMFVEDMRLPFDVAPLRGVPYGIGDDGLPSNVDRDRANLAENLKACRKPVEDSPLFQLVQEWPRPDIARLKTDRFRDLVEYSQAFRKKLEQARNAGAAAVDDVATEIDPTTAEPAVTIDLLLSYRSVENWPAMIDLIEQMPPLIGRSVLVREQLGFALNRTGRKDEAIAVLRELIDEHGRSSETCGILGRVYKDKWEEALAEGSELMARGFLNKAIDAYVAGFDADMRDPYPGINAVTLMEMADPVDARQADYLPVVSFVAARRLGLSMTDYWDYATMLELAVLARDQDRALGHLADALSSVRESWEPASTANNLRLIGDQRRRRNEDHDWIDRIVQELEDAAQTHAR